MNLLKRFTLMQIAYSGAGKTTRTLSATRFGKLLILDLDQKSYGALRNPPAELKLGADWKDKVVTESFGSTKDLITRLKKLKDNGGEDYATVCIDTFTALNDMIYVEYRGEKLETGTQESNKYEVFTVIGDKLLYIWNLLQALPCNLIINAHIKEIEDARTNQVSFEPAGRGGFRTTLQGKCSDAQFLVFEYDKYKVRVKNSDKLSVNTSIDPKYIDRNGFATTFSLEIFDDYAFKR